MSRHAMTGIVLAAVAVMGISAYHMFGAPRKDVRPAATPTTATPGMSTGAVVIPAPETRPIGAPLYTAGNDVKRSVEPEKSIADPVAINECRLTPMEKEDVPSQRNGVIWIIGTEIAENEEVPSDRLIVAPEGRGGKRYRRLTEGDLVKNGQLLAQLDDRLARDEWASKRAKILAAEADYAASQAAEKESPHPLRHRPQAPEKQGHFRGRAARAKARLGQVHLRGQEQEGSRRARPARGQPGPDRRRHARDPQLHRWRHQDRLQEPRRGGEERALLRAGLPDPQPEPAARRGRGR